jgi:hypothetical protein
VSTYYPRTWIAASARRAAHVAVGKMIVERERRAGVDVELGPNGEVLPGSGGTRVPESVVTAPRVVGMSEA